MVKNTTGGSKAKGQARKFTSVPSSQKLRISDNEFELYAQVSALLGNGMCHVLCIDGIQRLCHIRGKFRGRGKRDNIIGRGSWLLIGLREWESQDVSTLKKGKFQNCDLLEVYSENDKEKLKNTVKINWSSFVDNDKKNTNTEKNEEEIEFIDEGTEEYASIIEAQASTQNTNMIVVDNDEIINVDDI
jgi:translation initiation factor 1A